MARTQSERTKVEQILDFLDLIIIAQKSPPSPLLSFMVASLSPFKFGSYHRESGFFSL